MLTKSATITRACSASPRISSTQPVSVSLRHISSGSHKNIPPRPPRSLSTGRPSRGSARSDRPSAARRGSPTAAPRTAAGCPRATGRASQTPWSGWPRTRPSRTRASGRRTGSAATCRRRTGTSRTKGPEDPRRRARQHQVEGETERRRQRPLQPGGERGTDARCESLVAPLAAALHDFGADEARGAREHDGQRPGRADPDACAVVAQAGGRHDKDALKLRRQLKELDPTRKVLETQGRLHVIDARHRREALVEAHQRLGLDFSCTASPRRARWPARSERAGERCAAGARALEAADGGGAAADLDDDGEKQHRAQQDDGSGGHVAAIVAARVQAACQRTERRRARRTARISGRGGLGRSSRRPLRPRVLRRS
eukprot:3079097-Prymnesium_polylepis.1